MKAPFTNLESMGMKLKKKVFKTMFFIVFIFYICFLLSNILFKYVSPLELFHKDRYFSRSLNIFPFRDLLDGNFNKLDIYGNIILFLPLGVYIGILMSNIKIYKKIGIIIVMSLFLEIFQYVFGIGASDITDVITNTVGGIIGLGSYWIFKKLLKDDEKVKNFVTICSVIVLIPVVFIIIALNAYN